jgi:hypothetical protein
VEQFTNAVRALEAPDREVLVTGRGHLTSHRHFHMAALVDVVRVEHKLPDAIAAAFADRRFAEILIDNQWELKMPQFPEFNQELFRVVAANYYVAERLKDQVPPVAGFAALPLYRLHPRSERLDASDFALLDRRHALETMLVEVEAQTRHWRVPPPSGQPGIEEMAREMAARPVLGDAVLK